jgi:hypothetical protein
MSLLHAVNRWPSAINSHLWPYALRFANDVYTATPSLKNGRTPLESFSSTPVRPQVLSFHPPFCPTYVLHNWLQGGGKRPNKWVRRSRVAVYMGFSPRHARSVALVLGLTTGYLSPQFHLKFDDFFETVQDSKSRPPSKWQFLARFISKPGVPNVPKAPVRSQGVHAPTSQPVPCPSGAQESVPLDFDLVDPDNDPIQDQATSNDADELHSSLDQEQEPPQDPDRHRHQHEATRKSTRKPRPTRRLIETAYAVLEDTDAVEDYDTQVQAEDPIAFATSNKSDPDTLHYKGGMEATDTDDFKKAMLQEVDTHTENDHWEVWKKADVPANQDILPAIWAFKRKRRIDTRTVYKHKSRLNIHGGKQKHGINYWETYSPVVTWFSIRLCLILTLLLGWKTRQIDFVLAFPQAEVECDLFMQLPRGVTFS